MNCCLFTATSSRRMAPQYYVILSLPIL